MPAEGINPIEKPGVLYDEWQWFIELNNSRSVGLGASPISDSDLGWYFHTRQLYPEAWQLTLLRRLDALFRESVKGD